MNVYDFDGTIYTGDSFLDFFIYAIKRKPSLVRYLPRQSFGAFLYLLKRIDKTELKEYYFCFVKKINTSDFVERFWDGRYRKIHQWYLHEHKPDDVIISASPEFLLQPICEKMGIKYLIASKVNPETGKFIGTNCRGVEKVHRFYE